MLSIYFFSSSDRWIATGTPIQNGEGDLFAFMRFFRFEPFNDYNCWRQFVMSGVLSSRRLQIIINSLTIRRTKEQLKASGVIADLPDKFVQTFFVTLSKMEREAYNRIKVKSQQSFACVKSGKQAKGNDRGDKIEYDDRQANEAFTLLLRLRQACCHIELIKGVLEDQGKGTGKDKGKGKVKDKGNDKGKDKGEDEGDGVMSKVEVNKIVNSTGVDEVIVSSKMEAMMKIVQRILDSNRFVSNNKSVHY